MALLPDTQGSELGSPLSQGTETSDTYKMAIEEERIKGRVKKDIEALEQAVYKALNTERYRFAIYSWNYGVELADLFGKPIPYCMAEIPRRITEALLVDDRITAVEDFELSHNDGDVLCKFTVASIYGDISFSKEVRVR